MQKRDDKAKKILLIVTILLWVSAFLDLYTTLRYKGFYSLEASPLYFSLPILVIIKILLISFATYVIWRPQRFSKGFFAKFFYLHFVVLLIFAQGFAAYSNSQTQQVVVEKINQKYQTDYTPENIPKEVVTLNFVSDRSVLTKSFLNMILLILYIPFFLALVSFYIFEKLYLRGVKDSQAV